MTAPDNDPTSSTRPASPTNLPASTSRFEATASLAFGFRAFNSHLGTFLTLGVLHAALMFGVLDLTTRLFQFAEHSPFWGEILFGWYDLGSISDGMLHLHKPDLIIGVLLGVISFVINIATHNAAHQLCKGETPTFSSAFRNLPWGSPLLCKLVIGAAITLLSPRIIAHVRPVSDIQMAIFFHNNIINGQPLTRVTARLWHSLTDLPFSLFHPRLDVLFDIIPFFVAAVLGLVYLYLIPAATSGAASGIDGLTQSPKLVFGHMGSSLIIAGVTGIITAASTLVWTYLMPLWLSSVCILAVTHAYRKLQGLPTVDIPPR